jgi:hypothetical protein
VQLIEQELAYINHNVELPCSGENSDLRDCLIIEIYVTDTVTALILVSLLHGLTILWTPPPPSHRPIDLVPLKHRPMLLCESLMDRVVLTTPYRPALRQFPPRMQIEFVRAITSFVDYGILGCDAVQLGTSVSL